MKKIFLSATAIATVMSASTFAADLPSIKSAPAAPAPMWTGFYAGLNSGYGWGLTPGSYTQSTLFYDQRAEKYTGSPSGLGAGNSGKAIINQSGFLGGAQIGFNYKVLNRFIIGLETDIQGAAINGQGYYNGAGVTNNLIAGRNDVFDTAGEGQTQANINWFGTLRGRAGYLLSPTILTYVTGGLSYGGVTANNYFSSQTNEYQVTTSSNLTSQQILSGSGRASSTLIGWNIGGGAEWMFAPNWSIKSEILYYNLGSLTFGGWGYSPQTAIKTQAVVNSSSLNFAGIIARAGLNYHFNSDVNSLKPTSIIADFINPSTLDNSSKAPILWSGFYAGLNSGYGWSGHGILTTSDAYNQYANSYNSTEVTIGGVHFPGSVQPINGLAQANSGWSSVNQGGFLGGMQVGYNLMLSSRVIAGVETDLQGSTMRGMGSYSGTANTSFYIPRLSALGHHQNTFANGDIQAGMNWFGTLRGKLGYLITPSLMAFSTGGLSYGGVYAQTNFSSATNYIDNRIVVGEILYAQMLTGKGQASNSLVGWNAGGGIEWMLFSNWSIKSEALYYDLGYLNLTGSGYSPSATNVYSETFQSVNTKTSIHYNGVIARMGINYHFDLGKELPVVAKY